MKCLLITFFLILYALSANSQQLSYPLFEKAPSVEKRLLDAIEQQYSSDTKLFSGPHKKETIAIYRERADLVKQLVQQKEVLTDAAATDYLKAVTGKIFSANASITNTNLRIYFSRSHLPNASSMGEGTIVFNIGLFSRLDNEAQMAFVICHELAHYFLNHGNNSIDRYVQTVNSNEFQKQLKHIQKSEFEKNAQLEKLVMNLSFKHRRHGREFEQAADSMALSLLKNTAYDVTEMLSCLALLDSIDKTAIQTKLAVETQLNFAAYPFKKRWLGGSSLVFTDTEDEKAERQKMEDSLKTHPDCSKRITRLENTVKSFHKSDAKKFLVSEALFKKLQKLFELEALEYCLESGKVSQCLYFALKKLTAEPANEYVLGLTGRCFMKIYTAEKEHTAGKIIELPNQQFDEDYNSLLKVLQNLRLTELAAIQYYFLQTHQHVGKKNEEFLETLIRSKEYFEKPEEKKEWINYYYTNFPKHKYTF